MLFGCVAVKRVGLYVLRACLDVLSACLVGFGSASESDAHVFSFIALTRLSRAVPRPPDEGRTSGASSGKLLDHSGPKTDVRYSSGLRPGVAGRRAVDRHFVRQTTCSETTIFDVFCKNGHNF